MPGKDPETNNMERTTLAGFEIVGLSLACVVLVVTMMGPILAPQLSPILGITIDATPLVLYFFVFATIYNTILVTTLALQDRKRAVLTTKIMKNTKDWEEI